MLDYYKLLKNSRSKEINESIMAHNISTCALSWDAPSVIRTELDFMRTFFNELVYNTRWYSRSEFQNSHIYELGVGTLVTGENELYAEPHAPIPKSLFNIDSSLGVLGIVLIELLKDKYKVEKLEDLISTIDPMTDTTWLEESTEQLLLENNSYFGFFCPRIRFYNPMRIKNSIKIHEFKIREENIKRDIKKIIQRDLLKDTEFPMLRYSTYKTPALVLESITDRRIRVPIMGRTYSWVFSLNKEHLKEQLDSLYLKLKTTVEREVKEKEKLIRERKKELKDIDDNIEKLYEYLENFEKYKKNLWKNY